MAEMATALFLSALSVACFIIALAFPYEHRITNETIAVADNTSDSDEEYGGIIDNSIYTDDESVGITDNINYPDDESVAITDNTRYANNKDIIHALILDRQLSLQIGGGGDGCTVIVDGKLVTIGGRDGCVEGRVHIGGVGKGGIGLFSGTGNVNTGGGGEKAIAAQNYGLHVAINKILASENKTNGNGNGGYRNNSRRRKNNGYRNGSRIRNNNGYRNRSRMQNNNGNGGYNQQRGNSGNADYTGQQNRW